MVRPGAVRITVIDGATGSALDLCSRRSAGRGHHLCQQVVTAVEVVAVGARPRHRRGDMIYTGSRVGIRALVA